MDALLLFIKRVVFVMSIFLLPLKILVYGYLFFVSFICYFTFFCLSALVYFWQCRLSVFYCYILIILLIASFFERFLFNWNKFQLLFVSIFYFYSYIVQIGSIVFFALQLFGVLCHLFVYDVEYFLFKCSTIFVFCFVVYTLISSIVLESLQ